MRSLFPGLLLAVLASSAFADGPGVPAVHTGAIQAARMDHPVLVDGTLDEEVWKTATPVADFTQRDPDQGVPPRQKTEVRIAYDDDAVYVGARMFDTAPDSVVARVARRDNSANSDMFTILLDPLHDKRTGYYFSVTAGGVLLDGVLMNDEWDDDSWDGVWQGRVKRDDKGWTCEMRIPFSQMRFQAVTPMVWGVNFQRWTTRYNEQDAVVYTPRGQSGYVSRFPELHGLDGVHPGHTLELIPYVTNKTENLKYGSGGLYSADDPFHSGWVNQVAVGGDLRTSLGSKLTVNATVNPDFGQVEVDPAVVNLSDAETFFQEKRPFFTEGVSIFRCGNNGANSYSSFNWPEPTFFYSRRIGRSPQGGTPDADFTDYPTAVHILGAAKITGQAAPGWNVGTVQSVTSREEATLSSAGAQSKYGVEPLAYYGVWRVMHEMNDRRQGLGLMAMTTARSFEGANDPLRDEVNSSSVTATMDGWTFLDKKRVYVISGYATGSSLRGSTNRVAGLKQSFPHYYQRPDRPDLNKDFDTNTLTGWGSRWWLNKQDGDFMLNSAVGAISPGFDNNDLGFLNGADIINAHTLVGWQWQKPKGWRQYMNLMGALATSWDFGGNSTMKGYWNGWNLEQRNHWSWNATQFLQAPAFSSRATRGGPVMATKANQSWSFYFDTNGSKPWFWSIGYYPYYSANGSRSHEIDPFFQWRPKPSLTLGAGPSLYQGHTDAQFFTNVDPDSALATGSRFAQLEQTLVSMNFRVDYSATPNLSFQVYLQPLVSTLRYHGLKEFLQSRTYTFVALPDNSFYRGLTDDRSGTSFSLRGNAVLRWEYHPGSAMYFVWTQERADGDPTPEFDMGQSMRTLSTAPANNIFMIKIAHHFDL
jgi:uncharacterized protein DUF5916/cellulose/xylan binding protein with CBM9 domain